MRVLMVAYRGFSTRYIAERMARAFAAVGCTVVSDRPADLNFVYYRWMRKDGPVGRPRALWLVDEPYHWPNSTAWSRPFDWVFVNDRATLCDHHPLCTYWLPAAYEPIDVRRPVCCDVALVGAGFPNRRRLMGTIRERLKGLDVRLVGPRWPARWYADGGRDEWIAPEEAARYYAGARINLNLHRHVRHPRRRRKPTAVNFRALEIAAVGGFQIADDREDLALFIPSCPTFDGTAGDLHRKIVYYLRHDAERREIAEACRREVAPHTFEARARLVLEAVG